jgi:hypothetical protein
MNVFRTIFYMPSIMAGVAVAILWAALLNLTNTAPTLTRGNVTPQEYFSNITFYFNVTYTDAENNTADSIAVNINGTGYNMLESDTGDVNKIDGKRYYYPASLSRGQYQYNFTASDGFLNISYITQTNLAVTAKPTLTDIELNSEMDDPTTLFNFTVDYTDLDNDAEGYVNLTLDGTVYRMTEADPADKEYTNGKIYYINLTGLTPGTHHYNISAKDNRSYDTSVTTQTYTGPRVNTTASCTGDSPPGVGSSNDWVVSQNTVCGDSAFIPSSSGMTVIQDTLNLRNSTVYYYSRILNFTNGELVLNNTVIEFMD